MRPRRSSSKGGSGIAAPSFPVTICASPRTPAAPSYERPNFIAFQRIAPPKPRVAALPRVVNQAYPLEAVSSPLKRRGSWARDERADAKVAIEARAQATRRRAGFIDSIMYTQFHFAMEPVCARDRRGRERDLGVDARV